MAVREMQIQANIIDIPNREIFFGELTVQDGIIQSIRKREGQSNRYVLPGFVDAHVHIESSMLIPSEFARMAVVHGTIATVSDPHEIANVLGIDGVKYMIANGNRVPFKFSFGAPSCVPATRFETAGAVIGVDGVRELLEMPEIRYLAEMMNYPGVIQDDEEVHAKLHVAKQLNLPIDGHAPGVRGADVEKYIQAGISTDHECVRYDEGLEKLRLGMKILIREGSAAKNFAALIKLLSDHADQMMFCSDDKHPDDLIEGHINQLVSRAIGEGCELFDVLRAACINPVEHYGLPVGILREGDPADFIVTESLKDFTIKETYIDGQLVAKNGATLIKSVPANIPNQFNIGSVAPSAFKISARGRDVLVIRAIDGELFTDSFVTEANFVGDRISADLDQDILKIAVVNRYEDAPVAVALIQGFGLNGGAIASCVGHDSHNIIVVGADDTSMAAAVNLVVENRGGISAVSGEESKVLPLPVAGIMTNADGYETAKLYAEIDRYAKEQLGTDLTSPFMTLSFMALLVIPSLKLSDQGLFDGTKFAFKNLVREPTN
ncbi:MAG: adenine deaminase [Rubripirellula sp.]